jgi:peptidoglycan hydrolase-like protein with peptidoglycan-binding domain
MQPIDISADAYKYFGDTDIPAGMRNFNPGNLKYNENVPWEGLLGPSVNTDQGAPQAVFKDPVMGMRAAAVLAMNMQNKRGYDTVREIITSELGWTPDYLPAAENIAKAMGVGLDDKINLNDRGTLRSFLGAVVTQEHGVKGAKFSDDIYNKAIDLAMSKAPQAKQENEIAALQANLAHAGFSPGPIDGKQGRQTQSAVEAFQKSAGLTVDGIAGPQTMAALANYSPQSGPIRETAVPSSIQQGFQARGSFIGGVPVPSPAPSPAQNSNLSDLLSTDKTDPARIAALNERFSKYYKLGPVSKIGPYSFSGLDPEMARRTEAFLKDPRVSGASVLSAYRSVDQQQAIKNANPGGIAAQPGRSKHQRGLAVDFNKPAGMGWNTFHSIGKQYGLDFHLPSKDAPHARFDPNWVGPGPGRTPIPTQRPTTASATGRANGSIGKASASGAFNMPTVSGRKEYIGSLPAAPARPAPPTNPAEIARMRDNLTNRMAFAQPNPSNMNISGYGFSTPAKPSGPQATGSATGSINSASAVGNLAVPGRAPSVMGGRGNINPPNVVAAPANVLSNFDQYGNFIGNRQSSKAPASDFRSTLAERAAVPQAPSPQRGPTVSTWQGMASAAPVQAPQREVRQAVPNNTAPAPVRVSGPPMGNWNSAPANVGTTSGVFSRAAVAGIPSQPAQTPAPAQTAPQRQATPQFPGYSYPSQQQAAEMYNQSVGRIGSNVTPGVTVPGPVGVAPTNPENDAAKSRFDAARPGVFQGIPPQDIYDQNAPGRSGFRGFGAGGFLGNLLTGNIGNMAGIERAGSLPGILGVIQNALQGIRNPQQQQQTTQQAAQAVQAVAPALGQAMGLPAAQQAAKAGNNMVIGRDARGILGWMADGALSSGAANAGWTSNNPERNYGGYGGGYDPTPV